MATNVSFDQKMYTLDFSTVPNLRAGKGMQTVTIKMANGEAIVIGINRMKNPHKLYVITTDINKRWMGGREI